jgi:RNA polymerase sigma-70 factor (ECF subfamily)
MTATSGAQEDWIAVLAALEQGDPVAVAKVTAVISGWLAHYRANDLYDSWDDIIHEVLIRLIQCARRGAIREPRAFISYTGTTTRNLFLDWKDRQTKGESQEFSEQHEPSDSPTDPGALLDLQRIIDGLPEKQRGLVEAIYLQGHSYEEAAKLLDVPLGTLKRRLTQARKEIRKKMEQKGGSS